MTLELGTTDINEVWLGTTEIKKIYLGTTLVFDTTAAEEVFDATLAGAPIAEGPIG